MSEGPKTSMTAIRNIRRLFHTLDNSSQESKETKNQKYRQERKAKHQAESGRIKKITKLVGNQIDQISLFLQEMHTLHPGRLETNSCRLVGLHKEYQHRLGKTRRLVQQLKEQGRHPSDHQVNQVVQSTLTLSEQDNLETGSGQQST